MLEPIKNNNCLMHYLESGRTVFEEEFLMVEERIKSDSSDGNDNAVKEAGGPDASQRLLDELIGARFPAIDRLPADRPNYIPSPDNIAPIMLPGFFENYPKSPELDKVGEASDKLAHLLKGNASPAEQQKAWHEFENSAKGLPPNLAALRLNLSLYQQEVPGALSSKVDSYTGKISLIDYGSYQALGKLDYKAPESIDFNADKSPDVLKATAEFAERLQKGVSSDELKNLLPELLNKLAAANLDASSATSAIYWALNRAPNSKWDALNISREASYMVDGKPVRIYVNAGIFDKAVSLGITPEPRKVFG